MTLLYARLLDENTQEYGIINQEEAKRLGWKQYDIEPDSSGCRFYLKGHIPEKKPSQKAEEVRFVRDKLLENIQWRVERSLEQKELGLTPVDDYLKLLEYKQYLRDYTKQENWFESNPLEYEDWLNQ